MRSHELPVGTYFWHQVVGLRAVDPRGARIGTVAEVFRAGENEVYVIRRQEGDDLLIPALRSAVRSIDLKVGEIVVDYEPEEVR